MKLPRFDPLLPFDEVAATISPEEFVEIRGQRVYVRDEGEGETLVLLHGLASSAHSFREIFPRMADRYRLLAIDLNGFGNTERPKAKKAYHIRNQAELIVEILAA
ncbi:MAG: alpha/beta fold hydrolase, partial [Verrucomicrobiota bacterium]